MSGWLDLALQRLDEKSVPLVPRVSKDLRDAIGPADKPATIVVPLVPIAPKCPSEADFGANGTIGTAGHAWPAASSDTSLEAEAISAEFDAIVERAAILEFDACLPRDQADDAAARAYGYTDAAAYRRQLLRYWRTGLIRLLAEEQGRKGDDLIRNALAFIRDGWADRALDLGWTEQELVWADPNAPWEALHRLGAAYISDGIRLITASAIENVKRTGATTRLQRTRGDGCGCLPWQRELYEETTGG